jgi:hypothetical protein
VFDLSNALPVDPSEGANLGTSLTVLPQESSHGAWLETPTFWSTLIWIDQ